MALGTSDSASNLAPFRLFDLHFCYRVGTTEVECPWCSDGTIDTSRAEYLRVPMTPTKPDQSGERGDELFFPRSVGAQTYPLAKKYHTLEHLRTHAHLRPLPCQHYSP